MPLIHKRPSEVGLSFPMVIYFFLVTIDCSINCILHCMLQYGHWDSYFFSDFTSCSFVRKYFNNAPVKILILSPLLVYHEHFYRELFTDSFLRNNLSVSKRC